jgi:gas vesicle protein
MTSHDDDRSTASFLRGLTIGAIIGAILAGSSLWSRRRRGRRSSSS